VSGRRRRRGGGGGGGGGGGERGRSEAERGRHVGKKGRENEEEDPNKRIWTMWENVGGEQ